MQNAGILKRFPFPNWEKSTKYRLIDGKLLNFVRRDGFHSEEHVFCGEDTCLLSHSIFI
jgi:hypothetical protein